MSVKSGEIYSHGSMHYIRVLGRYHEKDTYYVDHWWKKDDGTGSWSITYPIVSISEGLLNVQERIVDNDLNLLIVFGTSILPSLSKRLVKCKKIQAEIEEMQHFLQNNKMATIAFEVLLESMIIRKISYESARLFIHIHTEYDIYEKDERLKSVL